MPKDQYTYIEHWDEAIKAALIGNKIEYRRTDLGDTNWHAFNFYGSTTMQLWMVLADYRFAK